MGAVAAAKLVLEDAEKALAVTLLAASTTNMAYFGLNAKNAEELEALQQVLDEAKAALELEKAKEEGVDAGVITELELAVKDAEVALEEFEPGENGIMYSHIIINSNKGGSFNEEEGNYSGVDGDLKQFTFDSKEGFDLVWLRIGNIKIAATDDIYDDEYSHIFNKKNLTIHAHFRKDKDYSPDPEITVEETDPEPEENVGLQDEDDEKGNGKGKDKEKSNNGKKKDK